ncbi:AraC family transcriptional regulator [Paenibacillus koleovorans]|uniref:AraC family transcriptional regulator n=1 Tax=Paenibacillus koleovorans TaxID=121608 RepID=UPI0013E33031|nr:AraC family transcriptional regulator [Paenibacillus koleovorans]
MSRNWLVYPMGYMYWVEKEQFLLEQDTSRFWTMCAVESGSFRYRIGEQEGEAGFGDVVVCPPETPFNRWTISPLTFHYMIFMWEEEPGREEVAGRVGKLSIQDLERLASTYRYLRGLMGEGLVLEEPLFGRFRHWLGDIWRQLEYERGLIGHHANDPEPNREDEPEAAMQAARSWLLEHAYEPFLMRELSDKLGLTAVQLTRRFRAAYRVTPSEFVTGLRIVRTSRLLEETALPLEAIAERIGYESGFYLSRIFSRYKGMPPSAYRKMFQV